MTIEDYLKIDYVDCCEEYDRNVLTNILASDNIDQTIKKILKRVNKNSMISTGNKVNYQLSGICKNNRLGRFYPSENQISIGRLKSIYRGTLFNKFYWDIDIANCHYMIINWYASQNKLDNTYITKYIENREEILEKIPVSRDIAKEIFLKILYGGEVDKELEEIYTEVQEPFTNSICYDELPTDIKHFISILKSEISSINKHIVSNNSDIIDLQKIISTCNSKKPKKNYEKTIVALKIQSFERALLLCLKEKLEFENRKMDVLIHDGGLIRKLENETIFPNELLIKCQDYVYEHTGIKIKLVNKPMIFDSEIINLQIDKSQTQMKTYKETKLEFEKNNFYIRFQNQYGTLVGNKLYLRDKASIQNDLSNLLASDVKDSKFFKHWMKDPTRRQYDNITFSPKNPNLDLEDETLYNDFEGFTIENKIDKGLIECDDSLDFTQSSIYKWLIEVICDNNLDVYNWLMHYINHMFFYPYEKTMIALVLASDKQGTGKSLLFNTWISGMLGKEFACSVGDVNELFQRFNLFLRKKILVSVDETNLKTTKAVMDKIKSFITIETLKYDEKNMKAFENPTNIHLCFFTQWDNALPIESSDRRFQAIKTSSKYANDKEYLKPVIDEIRNGKYNYCFYKYLKDNYDSKTFFTEKDNRVITSYYDELKSNTAPLIAKVLFEMIRNNDYYREPLIDKKMKSMDFFKNFNKTTDECNFNNHNISAQTFFKEINKFDNINCNHTKKGNEYDINIELLKNELIQKYKFY